MVYESYNGSLSPEYREKYQIEISKAKIIFKTAANEYNDSTKKLEPVISEKTVNITAQDFEEIEQHIIESGIINCKSSDDYDGGGT